MTEQVLSFFDNSGTPVTGLTPTITAINLSGDSLFSDTMTEVSWWWYVYTINNYDKTTKYLITVDGWVSMWANRYQYVTNELDAYDNKNDWKSWWLVIDNTAIAREVWATPKDNPRKWSYGEVVQREITIPKVDFTVILDAIKSIPKTETLSLSDIKSVIPTYSNEEILVGIKAMHNELLDKLNEEEEETEDQNILDIKSYVQSIESTLDNNIGKLDNIDVVIDILEKYIEIQKSMEEEKKEEEAMELSSDIEKLANKRNKKWLPKVKKNEQQEKDLLIVKLMLEDLLDKTK